MIKKFDPFEYENIFYEYEVKISNEEIKQIFLLVKKRHNNDQYTTYNNFNVLNFPILKNLKKQVTDILDDHKLLLNNNWAALYNKGDNHGIHNHFNSIYSGIIYLEGKKPSPTIFYSKEFSKYFHNFTKNTILLFPSTVPHEVEALKKDEGRLIISFNTLRK